ncbi:hypothetical protein Ccrd_020883 [Cynara cardunculus var. scolymus]|uniref:Purple acid phosphatase C-terminal domain-containing protein n=1 Tax=Cynara cardunculus var. scolymus TaxID=59895 RepID=A0A103Y1M1_CYNCS|nr:hypothetical protein Ccrd_020883 [Cynara cardunculus var. scolymus]
MHLLNPLIDYTQAASWSLVRIKEFGYVKVQTTTTQLSFEFVNANTRMLEDRFIIIKKLNHVNDAKD